MTWKELKKQIESMHIKMQDNEVWFLDEDLEMKHVALIESEENIYINPRWGVACFESMLDDDDLNDPLTESAFKEGDYYLLSN